MKSRPESDEVLVKRLLPGSNPDRAARARAWAEWQAGVGEASVLAFIRSHNNTREPDEDVLQDAMLTAYLAVERGNYQHRPGVSFAAYVKGIARNKIREARRHQRRWTVLDDAALAAPEALERQLETTLERQEQREALWRGLARLTARRRQVLERYLGGHSTSEIAEALTMTEALVRQHKSRGLRSLRQLCRPTQIGA